MEDICLFKLGWKWLYSRKHVFLDTQTAIGCFKERMLSLFDQHWPKVCHGIVRMGKFLVMVLLQWRDSVVRGFRSLICLGSTPLFIVVWSCFLSFTSNACLIYVLLSLGAAGAAIHYLGNTPGLFIVGLFGILTMWMYGNFWIMGLLFIIGGYFFSLNHARLVILMANAYALYFVQVRAGWLGVFLSLNLACLSSDVFAHMLQVYDKASEAVHVEEQKESVPIPEEFSGGCDYSTPSNDSENVSSCKFSCKAPSTSNFVNIQKDSSVSKVVKVESSSVDEMKRIMKSLDHYEALGLPRNQNLEVAVLRKEYRKKAMLVHPDKNMGSPIASESFKKLQCAYEVLSDSTKKRNYDEQLRKEESRSVCQKSHGTSKPDGVDYCSEESRPIRCTKCGNSHIWICTNRSKAKARWCEDCCQHHPAKDGDGWVEYGCSFVFAGPQKVEIPRAFVCAESKIFDVSEWAICQGMSCRPNTHRPTFQVNMVGQEKSTQKSNPSRYAWDLDAEKTEDSDEEFQIWFQQALASGLFSEPPKRRKPWSPFKLHHKKSKWRR